MYIIICETNLQSRLNAWDRVLRAGALGWPWGMGWRGRWEGSSGWGTHVHPWLIHVSVWQKPLQYCNQPPIKIINFLKKVKRQHRLGGEKIPPRKTLLLGLLHVKIFSQRGWVGFHHSSSHLGSLLQGASPAPQRESHSTDGLPKIILLVQASFHLICHVSELFTTLVWDKPEDGQDVGVWS